MLFAETPIFTRRVTDVLDDDQYRRLQQTLADDPTIGAVFPTAEDCGSCVGRAAAGGSGAEFELFITDWGNMTDSDAFYFWKKRER